jgi:phage tail sheath protein FI
VPVAGTLDELQEATQPDFSDAATLSIGTAGKFAFIGRPAGDYFYRVRRLLGARTSEWSNGVGVRVASATGFVSFDDDDTEDPHLVTIHEAMLRMCAARADLVALLSLPRHYDDRRAITHSTSLMTALEPQALSYGGLWHPWLIGRDNDAGPLRAIPPDGATAGVMARRAIERGAWVAPANEPLFGVLALTPDIPAQARQALQDAAVNLIRRDPAGFLCLDADTLSSDEDVRPLNVRRLLILVRRAALRTGNDYAFEPHSINLRNTIKRGFESMLSTMYLRGAFAGRTAKSAFQVVTDETVNTPQSTDGGRFIAELKIAPSRPLSFLTVRLVQRGEASTAEEVR